MKSKNNKVIYEYDLVPYPRKLWVVIGADYEFIKSKFRWNKKEDGSMEFPTDDPWSAKSAALTFGDIEDKATQDYGILLWIMNDLDNRDIVHESFHILSTLFDEMGISYDANNQEVFSYPMAQIYSYVETALKSHKKK